MKSLVRSKAEEYVDRAEKLKQHLQKPEPARVGANGTSTGSGGKKCVQILFIGGVFDDGNMLIRKNEGEDDDPDTKKLRSGLTSDQAGG